MHGPVPDILLLYYYHHILIFTDGYSYYNTYQDHIRNIIYSYHHYAQLELNNMKSIYQYIKRTHFVFGALVLLLV